MRKLIAMKTSIMAATLAPLFVAAQGAGQAPNSLAQTPQTPPAPRPIAQPTATTLVGCLYREDQVPAKPGGIAGSDCCEMQIPARVRDTPR
jgi:hypothetical protein